MSISILSRPSTTTTHHYPLREELSMFPPSKLIPRRSAPEPADQSSSRLLALPPELRTIIWSYLLIQPQTPRASASQRNPFGARSTLHDERFCANVLRTCRQIYREGLPILYGENTFAAHSQLLTGLPSFLLVTRPHRVALSPVKHTHLARLIRKFYLFVRLDTDPRFTARQVDEAFTGVHELEIEVFQAMYGSCDFGVLRLFEGVRGVGKAVVQGSVGDGRYAAWLARTMMLPAGSPTEVCDPSPVADPRVERSWWDGNR